MSTGPPGPCGIVRCCLSLGLTLLGVIPSWAHVNSPHTYLEENAGPYPVIVVVHMPTAVPGEAELQLRLQDRRPGEEVEVLAREVPPGGEEFARNWLPATPSAADPDFFTAPLPLMAYGLWRAQVRVSGPRGDGLIDFPLSARRAQPRQMNVLLSVVMLVLTAILLASAWQIVFGLRRNASRTAGQEPSRADTLAARGWAAVGLAVVVGWFAFIGYSWYRTDRSQRARGIPALSSELTVVNQPAVAGKRLSMRMEVIDRKGEGLRDVAPDHGKMMHLIGVKLPDASYFLHVHPRMTAPGVFAFRFTPPEAGTYKFFGDILHTTGEGRTVTNLLEVDVGRPLGEVAFEDPDDSHSFQTSSGEAFLGNATYDVGDGLVMQWVDPDPASIFEGEFVKLVFELVHAGGEPVEEIEPYMGMAGHMLIMRHDAEVFAHLHPTGSIAGRMKMRMPAAAMDMAGMETERRQPAMKMPEVLETSRASFPYGFPESGDYRLWVQMKRGGRVYTGVFDVRVD